MEISCQKHRDGRELLVEGFGTEVGRGRELADVQRQVTHHPSVGGDLRLYSDVVETQPIHDDVAAKERLCAAV